MQQVELHVPPRLGGAVVHSGIGSDCVVEAGQLGSSRELVEDPSFAAGVSIMSDVGPERTSILERRIGVIVAADQIPIAAAIVGELHLFGVILRNAILDPPQHVAQLTGRAAHVVALIAAYADRRTRFAAGVRSSISRTTRLRSSFPRVYQRCVWP
ncbi:MAG: hypothetical protein HW416_3493 [Chloroflexi bacterium]|nr:hypothetical protein [Chloroflexota bacterium]